MAGHFVQLFEHAEKNLIPSLVQVLNTGVFKAACAIMELFCGDGRQGGKFIKIWHDKYSFGQ